MDEEILRQIIEKYDTPIYVFDINKLRDRILYLKSKLPSNINICYAIKANAFIIKYIEDIIDRFEVCSPGEFEICKEKRIDKSKVFITGVYKDEDLLSETIKQYDSDLISIESMEQFEYIYNNAKNKINLMLRLTSGNQFGINKSDIYDIIEKSRNNENMHIVGIQYFSGTQKVSLKNIQREIEHIDEFLIELKEKYNYIPEEVEYGAGFPVFYFEGDSFDEEKYLEEFSNIIKNMKYNGKKYIELGRSIVANCGNYITKVVDKKKNKDMNFAILDGGIHHLTYYGQSMAMKFPKCLVYPKRESINEEKWNLCGSLCTINDILIKQFPVSNLNIDDIFVFENTGAYCSTEGISLFLSRDLPQVLIINKNNEIELVRKHIKTYKFNM